MKTCQFCLAGLLILFLSLGVGCAKKVIRSEAAPYTVAEQAPKPPEPQPAPKTEMKEETLSPAKPEGTGERAGIKEETLQEKALREQAAREEAARRAAAARKTETKKGKLESIYFDFDLWSIRDDQKEIMVKDAEWLKAEPQTRIRIEGNCDERGTSEYNLALGQKRAEAAKGFLKGLGIAENRMETISYGEERPMDPGHDEAAWAKNRRVDFVPIR